MGRMWGTTLPCQTFPQGYHQLLLVLEGSVPYTGIPDSSPSQSPLLSIIGDSQRVCREMAGCSGKGEGSEVGELFFFLQNNVSYKQKGDQGQC